MYFITKIFNFLNQNNSTFFPSVSVNFTQEPMEEISNQIITLFDHICTYIS